MKIRELTEGVLGNVKIGKYNIAILTHVKDRLKKRKLTPQHLTRLLKSIPRFEDKIDQLEIREGFFIVDQKLNISIGASRYNNDTLTIITIIDSSKPYARGVDKYFYI